jgi:glutathione S-transferase
MRLYNGPTSPFGRKVSVLYRELGLAVDEIEIDVYKSEFLDALNPLRLIPTLELADGTAIYDSTVISLYLMELAERPDLLPQEAKWQCLTTCSLCDGLMEAVLQRRMETLRPEKERSEAVIDKLEMRIARALAALAASLDRLSGDQLRLDRIAAACALEYVSNGGSSILLLPRGVRLSQPGQALPPPRPDPSWRSASGLSASSTVSMGRPVDCRAC